MHVCMNVSIHACMYIHKYIYICMYECSNVWRYVHMNVGGMYVRKNVHMYVCMHAYLYM